MKSIVFPLSGSGKGAKAQKVFLYEIKPMRTQETPQKVFNMSEKA